MVFAAQKRHPAVKIVNVNNIFQKHLVQVVGTKDGTGQHFCSPARPEVTRNHPARTVYAKPQIIFWPGP